MKDRSARRALALSLLMLGLAGSANAAGPVTQHYQQAARNPDLLMMRLGEIDPTKGQLTLPAEYDIAAVRSASGREYSIVQFDGALTERRADELRAGGWELLEYVPNNAYLVRSSTKDRGSLAAAADVRWMDEVRPAYKVEPELIAAARNSGHQAVDALIVVWQGESRRALVERLLNLGIDVLATPADNADFNILTVRLPGTRLPEVAALPEVEWIERPSQLTLRNNTVVGAVQSGVAGMEPIWDRGLHGEGQVVGHIDGLMDHSSCYFTDTNPIGPTHRKVVGYFPGTSGSFSSHGNHTAGTAAGKNASGDLNNAGVAYEAKLSHASYPGLIPGVGSDASSNDANFYNALTSVRGPGARVHTNSWGEDGRTNYTYLCVAIDRFTWDNEDDLVVFASTNQSTLFTPENSKNVLAVGATEHTPNVNDHSSGGVGPTSDGRRKPEIYAPGTSTVSANLTSCGTGSSTGTSMASPAITGAAALARQYFTEGWYPGGMADAGSAFTPSGALLKATLLNGTLDMTGVTGYPSNLEGWGRLVLDNVLFFDGEDRGLFVHDERRSEGGLSTGQAYEKPLVITGAGETLKVTLVWNDPPVAHNAAMASVNNLDLEVVSPGGDIYRGNVFSGGNSATGGTADTINNVEMVQIPSPAMGTWTLRVRGTSVNAMHGTQGFALVATGELVNGGVSISPNPVSCGTPLSVRVTDGNTTATTLMATVTTTGGDSEDVLLTGDGSGSFTAMLPTTESATPTTNSGTLDVLHGDTIEASYLDDDNGTGSAELFTAQGAVDCVPPFLSGIIISAVTEDSATVEFSSSEPVTGTAYASATCNGTDYSAPIEPVTARSAPYQYRAVFTGLPQGTDLTAHVLAEDAAGNVIVDDNMEMCYPFTTMVRIVTALLDFEPAEDGATTELPTGTSGWTLTTSALAHSPAQTMFVPNTANTTDARLVSPAFMVAPGADLTFWHTHEFEIGSFGSTTYYDGGVLEYSTDGSTWTDAGSLITEGGYNAGAISNGFENPLGGRPGWGGGTLGAMTKVRVDLSSLAGQMVQMRWRFGSDELVAAEGWHVDDIVVSRLIAGGVPTPTPTATPVPPTATPTATAAPTTTVTPTPTVTPTFTPTPSPTATPTASPTPTQTPSPTATATPEPTATPTPEPTATPTPEPTATPTPEPTATPTPEPTATPTPSPTPEPTPTATPTATPEPTATATPTVTPSPTPVNDSVVFEFTEDAEGWSSQAFEQFSSPEFFQSNGALRLAPGNNTSTFGFFFSPTITINEPVAATRGNGGISIDGETGPGALYSLETTVSSTVKESPLVPTVRVRASSGSFEQSDVMVITSEGDGSLSPGADARSYTTYFTRPEGQTSFALFFEILNFDPRDSASGELALDRVEVRFVGSNALGDPSSVFVQDFADSATNGWTPRVSPPFTEPVFSATDAGLRISGASAEERGLTGIFDGIFGFWGHESTFSVNGGTNYRIDFTMSSEAGGKGGPSVDDLSTFRVRVNDSTLKASAYMNFESTGNSNDLPSQSDPKTYSLHLYVPEEIDSSSLIFSFDFIDTPVLENDATIGIILNKVEVFELVPR